MVFFSPLLKDFYQKQESWLVFVAVASAFTQQELQGSTGHWVEVVLIENLIMIMKVYLLLYIGFASNQLFVVSSFRNQNHNFILSDL